MSSNSKGGLSPLVPNGYFQQAQESEFYRSIHSFMADGSESQVARSFTEPEWDEICGQWPTTQIPAKTVDYVESFSDVKSPEELEDLLKRRPKDVEEQPVYRCYRCFEDWQEEVWGVTRKLAKTFVNCKMLPGKKAGIESKERQSRSKARKDLGNTRACSMSQSGIGH